MSIKSSAANVAQSKEIWKDIFGYEGLYQVSNFGRVKSLKRFGKPKDIILKPGPSHGYPTVNLCKNGAVRNRAVHQLVAITFLGHNPFRGKLVVDHINNVRTDNRLCNLQIISQRENTSKDRKGGSSKYVGVSLNKHSGKWIAYISLNNKNVNLGSFDKEIDAHNAYQSALKKLN